jgi:hypothetical protein
MTGFFMSALELGRKVKNPAGLRRQGFWGRKAVAELLQLGFLVQDMLACLRVELHEFELCRRRLLVLVGGVEMTRTSSRFQLDFFSCAFGHGDAP